MSFRDRIESFLFTPAKQLSDAEIIESLGTPVDNQTLADLMPDCPTASSLSIAVTNPELAAELNDYDSSGIGRCGW